MAAVSPPHRSYGAIAEHTGTSQLVMVGAPATNITKLSIETWLWNGSVWSLYSGKSPNSRTNHTMSYDGTNIVLFGGKNNSNHLGDCWTWNGSSWNKYGGTTPSPRTGGSLAYLSGTGAIHFGGKDLSTHYAETWVWTGSAWTKSPATGPAARVNACLAGGTTYALLFGGSNSSGLLNDCWKFQNNTWTQVPNTVPARSGAVMCYDATNSNYVLFGGIGGNGYLNDTWIFSTATNTWSKKQLSVSPVAREGAVMSYDSTRGNVMMFGGHNILGALNDTYIWTGSAWVVQ
jgi:hypothetical protein